MSQTRSPARGRASWSGLLQVSLVAVPVKAYPAVSSSDCVQLNQLHAGCGHRIRYEKHCPAHGKVEAAEIVKAYQYAPDQYVLVDETELNALRPPREKALQLEQFVDSGQVDPARYCGRTLYLLPDGLPAQRAYHVLATAMQARCRAAVGRMTLSARRCPVVVRPAGRLLVLHVLHDPPLLRAAAVLEPDVPAGEPAPQELELACALIDSASGSVDWDQYRDDTAQKLAELVETKLTGRELPPPAEEPAQVLRLLDGSRRASRRPPVRSWLPAPSAAAAENGGPPDAVPDPAHAGAAGRAVRLAAAPL